ncbi:MAG: hypothetical protein KQI81_08825 [Deltaproteobacteria bacterium]|nr:hypothetical protein [Deltaproteobacteria bacterium]
MNKTIQIIVILLGILLVFSILFLAFIINDANPNSTLLKKATSTVTFTPTIALNSTPTVTPTLTMQTQMNLWSAKYTPYIANLTAAIKSFDELSKLFKLREYSQENFDFSMKQVAENIVSNSSVLANSNCPDIEIQKQFNRINDQAEEFRSNILKGLSTSNEAYFKIGVANINNIGEYSFIIGDLFKKYTDN